VISKIYLAAAIAAILFLMGTHYAAFNAGKDVEKAERLKAELAAKIVAEKVADGIDQAGRKIAGEVNASIAKIKITNTTVNRQIEREKEFHHVLSNPDCAVPLSTVRVRNSSRIDRREGFGAGQRADDGVLKPSDAERKSTAVDGG